MKDLNLSIQRAIAISAARTQLRLIGLLHEDLVYKTRSDEALEVLDDLLRKNNRLIASIWYKNASEYQLRLFRRDWRRWQRRWKKLDIVKLEPSILKAGHMAIDLLNYEKEELC